MSNSVSFKAIYKNTDFTRTYEFDDVSEDAILIPTIRQKVIDINASLAGGQADALANLFVSEDYDSQENIGSLTQITDLKVKTVTETDIPNTNTRHILNADQFLEDNPDEFPPEDQPKEDDQR